MTSIELRQLITELFQSAGISIGEIVDTIDESDGSYWFAISSPDSKLLIGKNGEHLQALNTLVRKILEAKNPENTTRVVIDINNYQKERVDNVKALAHMMAERARFFKSSVSMDPMTSFERRVIHEFLKDKTDLKTESEGEGKERKVVIKYIGTIA